MENKSDNKSNLIRGIVEILTLRILLDGESYGYEISNLIEKYSDGLIDIPVGTLYPSLNRLLEKGYISVDKRIIGNRFRIYYQMLDEGRAYYASIVKDYDELNDGVRRVLAPRNHKGKE
jgi:PadR family transcriptional regulator PadR